MSTRRNGSEVMDRILEAATGIFASEGLAGARMDEIAARAGVSKALIYYHVADKETLYASVMKMLLDRARGELVEAVAAAADPEQRLRLAIGTIARLAATPHFAPLMLREIASGGAGLPDALLAEMRKVFGVVAETLAEGTRSGEFREIDPYATHMLLAGGLLVLMAGTPLRKRVRSLEGDAGEPEAIPDYVASLLLDGIRTPAAAGRRPARKK